jgi:hypothetical protein
MPSALFPSGKIRAIFRGAHKPLLIAEMWHAPHQLVALLPGGVEQVKIE